MKALNQIDTKLLVAVDIETVRTVEFFENAPEETQSAWEYKNKQDGEIPEYTELQKRWINNTSLYAEFSKVCAVSLSYLNPQGQLVCKEFYGEDEQQLLLSLGTTLDNMVSYNPDYRLVGHAAKYFDYPFLCKRFVINGLTIPTALDSTAAKPWEQRNLCTNELWKMGGTGAGSSLQALCNCLGIPTSKTDLVGDEVGSSYYRGEYERIARYCSQDSIATFNVVRKFKKESIFQFDEVSYITAYPGTEVKPKQINILEKIYRDNTLTEETKAELEKIFKKKKPAKKDKEHIFTILRGAYVRTNFENGDQDSKAVIEKKEKEINDFISNVWP